MDETIENPNSFLKYGLLQILQNLVGYKLPQKYRRNRNKFIHYTINE